MWWYEHVHESNDRVWILYAPILCWVNEELRVDFFWWARQHVDVSIRSGVFKTTQLTIADNAHLSLLPLNDAKKKLKSHWRYANFNHHIEMNIWQYLLCIFRAFHSAIEVWIASSIRASSSYCLCCSEWLDFAYVNISRKKKIFWSWNGALNYHYCMHVIQLILIEFYRSSDFLWNFFSLF